MRKAFLPLLNLWASRREGAAAAFDSLLPDHAVACCEAVRVAHGARESLTIARILAVNSGRSVSASVTRLSCRTRLKMYEAWRYASCLLAHAVLEDCLAQTAHLRQLERKAIAVVEAQQEASDPCRSTRNGL
jgi:hypothetical protein